MTQKQQTQQKERIVEFELSAMKVRQLNQQPIIESTVSMSEDGKWLIHKTVITDIKPVSYLEKVLGNNRKEE